MDVVLQSPVITLDLRVSGILTSLSHNPQDSMIEEVFYFAHLTYANQL